MPTSPVFDLPYPGPGDPNNVPADIYALVGRLEEVLVEMASGVYTPTVTGVSNALSVTAHPSIWIRVGDIVTVTGRADVTANTNSGVTLGVSLPVPSNLGGTYDLSGLANSHNAPRAAGTCVADTANDRATIAYLADNSISNQISYQFSYRILP